MPESETIHSMGLTLSALVLLAMPLFTFLFLIFLGRIINKYRGYFATTVMLVSFVLALNLFLNIWGNAPLATSMKWFSLGFGGPDFGFGIWLNNEAVLMLVIVTFVSFLVHLFSIEYLRGDRNFEKYFAYLGLFTFSMLGIVMSDNLLMIFIFWELVGVSSYLLIGFYYQKPEASFASKKAFIMNRVGDAGFLIGIMTLFTHFQTLQLEELIGIFQGDWAEFGISPFWLTVAGLGLFCGAIGKSAQFPLLNWLPNAMEGPTPVSALIHAATMVAAGVYLLARVFFLLDEDVHLVITIIGTITAFMGAFSAFAQKDIKRVLAFSTISQLGYMIMGMGVGAYEASLFHLMTHAFFKACLFLSAGAVIHSMHHVEEKCHKDGVSFDPQNMWFMGGLRKRMPVTFAGYILATAALAGLPFFSGFLSKDAILTGAMSWANVQANPIAWLVPVMGFITAGMTAAYMGRQVFLVFFGEFRIPKHFKVCKEAFQYVIETPWLMRVPIIILSVLSLAFFFSLNPFDAAHSWFFEAIVVPESMLNQSLIQSIDYHEFHLLGSLISVGLGVCGIAIAWHYFKPSRTTLLPPLFWPQSKLYKLSENNWYMDEIYDKVFVKVTEKRARAFAWFDKNIVDKMVNSVAEIQVIFANMIGWFDRWIVDGFVNGMVLLSGRASGVIRGFQSGSIQGYIIFTIFFLVLILIWLI